MKNNRNPFRNNHKNLTATMVAALLCVMVSTGCSGATAYEDPTGSLPPGNALLPQTQPHDSGTNAPMPSDKPTATQASVPVGATRSSRPPRRNPVTNGAIGIKPQNPASPAGNVKPMQPSASAPTSGDIARPGAAGTAKPAGATPGLQPAGSQQTNTQNYTLEQAMSDNAQLSTIAFSGLAFLTGSDGADTFMPPGKVADFFGFQYMRDVDTAGYGHNTTFLSRVANNVLSILDDAQTARMVALAKTQAPQYIQFAYNRYPLMNAFRRSLEGDVPSGSSGLDLDAVSAYTSSLYRTDADLSYNRAVVVGDIIRSFSDSQKAYLAKMEFDNYLSWPDVAEDDALKRSLTNSEFVAVMTYASELFSWYKGGLDADVYFCPERHGTYFGGFYMKDYPAMNNPDYFISTAITGDKGKMFLDILDTKQRALVTGIIDEQRSALEEVAAIRTTVSTELRKSMSGGTVDKAKVYSLIERYGELDGWMSGLYASRFSAVNSTLTDTQRTALVKLRDLSVVPQGGYLFSTPVAMPVIANTDWMFGVGSAPSGYGQTAAPASFAEASKSDARPAGQ